RVNFFLPKTTIWTPWRAKFQFGKIDARFSVYARSKKRVQLFRLENSPSHGNDALNRVAAGKTSDAKSAAFPLPGSLLVTELELAVNDTDCRRRRISRRTIPISVGLITPETNNAFTVVSVVTLYSPTNVEQSVQR